MIKLEKSNYQSLIRAMTKIYLQPYVPYSIAGVDFLPVEAGGDGMQRILFSPDGLHSISVMGLSNDALLIKNESNAAFNFSLSRKKKVLAVVSYKAGGSSLQINSNWRISANGVENREIHGNPDLVVSKNMNIDWVADGITRVDIKIGDSGHACCVFSENELLFVRMNGHHVLPRLGECVRSEAYRTITPDEIISKVNENPELQEKIGKKFIENWMVRTGWGSK